MWRWLKLPLAQSIGVQIFTMYTEIHAHIKTIFKRMFFYNADGYFRISDIPTTTQTNRKLYIKTPT